MLLVYRKTLYASTEAAPPAGKVLALLTSDVNVIGLLLPQLLSFVASPVQLIGTSLCSRDITVLIVILAIVALLYLQIGPYAFISVGIMLLVLPIAAVTGAPHSLHSFQGDVGLGKKVYANFGKHQGMVDRRVKLVNELIQALRIVKVCIGVLVALLPLLILVQYYAWEVPMEQNIMKARKDQLHILRTVFKWQTGMFIAIGTSPIVAMGSDFHSSPASKICQITTFFRCDFRGYWASSETYH
jgi:hypothetical protein